MMGGENGGWKNEREKKEQERQCAYYVMLMRVRVTIGVVEKRKALHILSA
jgi:hypothetical protein